MASHALKLAETQGRQRSGTGGLVKKLASLV
jgi:hypothetical protein